MGSLQSLSAIAVCRMYAIHTEDSIPEDFVVEKSARSRLLDWRGDCDGSCVESDVGYCGFCRYSQALHLEFENLRRRTFEANDIPIAVEEHILFQICEMDQITRLTQKPRGVLQKCSQVSADSICASF